MSFTRVANALTTETLARIVAELTDEDGCSVSLEESLVVRDAEFVGRPRVGDERFEELVESHRQQLRQELAKLVRE